MALFRYYLGCLESYAKMKSSTPKFSVPCHVCGQYALEHVKAFKPLPRITSDCKLSPSDVELALCSDCGVIQKMISPEWRREVEDIYNDYDNYQQGTGSERAVFNQSTGAPVKRSNSLLGAFVKSVNLPENGAWLDIGCGNGALLRAISDYFPQWILTGTELSDENRSAVEGIPQVDHFHCGPISGLDEKFDAISMIHVLEHIENPVKILKEVRALMNETAILLIQLPYCFDNPFDLAITDHCSHFTPDSLSRVLMASGFDCLHVTTDWINREISLIATPGNANSAELPPPSRSTIDKLHKRISWLESIVSDVRELAERGHIGIFGSSIGASFACGAVNSNIEFFVDEDESHVGQLHLGKSIISPNDIPKGVPVYIPLTPNLAINIAERLDLNKEIFVVPRLFD